MHCLSMFSNLIDTTVQITSRDPNCIEFGAGFIALRTGEISYIVTCSQIIQSIGKENILVNDLKPNDIVVDGDDMGLDLAVIRVELLPGNATLSSRLIDVSEPDNQKIEIPGFEVLSEEGKFYNQLSGRLSGITQMKIKAPYRNAQSFQFLLSSGEIGKGYIGSPLVDSKTKFVVGIVSQNIDNSRGIAIAISELDRIWHPIDKGNLRRVLTDLGFKDHRLEFFKIIRKNRMSMYLIHGPTDRHAQRWMLNRLVQHFLPKTIDIAGKFKIDLCRVGRRSDVQSIWEELGMMIAPSYNRKSSPREIAKATIDTWLRKDIIIAIYNVNVLSEQALNRLIQDFWLPLVNEMEATTETECTHKILMFLVDNEGVTAMRNVPAASQINTPGIASQELNSTPLGEFTREELMSWMANNYPDLPETLIDGVESLLDASDGGIPEWTFIEICRQLGYHWKAESQEWYVV